MTMALPPALEESFREDVERIQQEKRMPYVTSIERVDFRRGLRQGIETLLQERFGEEGIKLMPEIREIYDEPQLLAILKSLVTASSPEELRKLWAPGGP